jgi:predicted RNA-binding Zn-ribbon protein involved in translation (DUF1610 family)
MKTKTLTAHCIDCQYDLKAKLFDGAHDRDWCDIKCPNCGKVLIGGAAMKEVYLEMFPKKEAQHV